MRRASPLLSVVLLVLIGPAACSAPDRGAQTITIDDTRVINAIEHPFWGVNYVGFWDPIQGSDASRQALRHAGVQLIRFPGGEPANWLDWSKPAASPYWTTTSTAALWEYARGVNARLLLQTNPTTNEVSDTGVTNDPSGEHAAGWVAYAKRQGIAAPYWEIGNEPDRRLEQGPEALQSYLDTFELQARAMKQADPQIKVFGPAGTNVYQWWRLGSLEQFLRRQGDRQGSGLADGVSLHYYPVDGCLGRDTAWETVRSVSQEWPAAMDYITGVIARYDTRPLPVFITETNAAVGGMDCDFNVNQTVAAALANADLFGVYRATGVQAVQFFGAIHGSGHWGLLYGADEARPADTPTPSYFILPIWTRAGDQVLQVSGATDPARTLSAYASKRPDGSVQVVLINKTPSPLPVTLRFSSFDPAGGSVRVYELRPAEGDVLDADVVYNGVRAPGVGEAGLPPPAAEAVPAAEYTRQVPGYSLTLLDFDGGY